MSSLDQKCPTWYALDWRDSHRQTGFIMTLGYLRFVGESRPSSRWPVPRRGISSQEDDVAGRWAGNGLDTHMEG